ncbi:MAG TPA: PD-(D/E)XK nuclease family protein [Nitrospirae bacterium]|nr:ATP-dependent helicase/deoxyribonuclease subunit B [bacterium BMS3Abin06]HDH12500.1 PD-(D/E)XK nuclease family protein [Nitrospirota bacterium]HDZ02189.1 PD-(D/E)XK nuclease family protein [Nitrospirota bacterium]
MQEGTLFIAPPGTGIKKESIFKEIVSLCPDNNYSSVLYLGPNNFLLSSAKSRFFSYLKKTFNKSVYIPFQSLTIKQLAADLHETHGINSAIPERIRTLILYEILKEKNIGYARLLSGLIKKIIHYIPDKTLSRIKEEIRHLIFEEKAADRAVRALDTLRLYEDELRAKNLLDPDDIFKKSIPLIREHMAPGVLVIDGFHDPTRLETEIIRALIDKAEKVLILAEEGTEILEYLQSMKLKPASRKTEQTSCRKKSGYYSYPSMEDEVEGIARGIKKLIFEGLNPWEVTVSFPLLSKYLPMARRVFRRHGIPVSIGEYNLSSTRPFAALGEMITCIEEDYPAKDFLSFLTSPYFPAVPAVVKERAVSYSYKAGTVKGKNAWLSIKDILLNSLQKEIPADEKEQLNEFQKGTSFIVDIIENLKQKKDLLTFIDAFESALDKLGFFDSPVISQSTLHRDEISGIINNRLTELRQFGMLYGPGHYHIDSPPFYLRYLFHDLKGSEENRDGIKILPFELAAGSETKALFFGGMLEGDFPSRPDIDPILPEKVKKELGMPYLEYYLKRQRAYFNRLLNVPVYDPWFSCPSAEGDKIFLPSPFLDWGEALSPPDLNIYTEEDVLIREGAYQHAGSEAKIFRVAGAARSGGEMFPGRNSLGLLGRRINTLFKGFVSVTAIDYYRKCPLRFYIERILGLEIESPPRFEVESRLWGTLAHKTMEYLFKDGDIELDLMDEKIFQGLEKSLKEFPIGDFWSRVAREIFRKLLPLLKEEESDIRMQGFSPRMLEKSIKAEINGLRLKGKIDRVDRREHRAQTDDNGEQGAVILLDYKTGSVDRESLQMPLYARMWQENFPETVEKTGYYSLKEGHVKWFPKKIGMEEFMQDAMQKAEEIAGNMNKGMFPAMPFKDTECRYCYHSPLCKSGG